MQITIDTQKDSQSEIKKAIKLLQSLVGEVSQDSELPAQSDGFTNMFNSGEEQSESSPQVYESEESDENDDPRGLETY